MSRNVARSQELLTPAFAGLPQASPCGSTCCFPRYARINRIAACLGPLYVLPKVSSFGLMLSLTAKPSSFAITFDRFRSRAPHPFGPRNPLFLSGKSRLAILPRAVSAHLAACLNVPGKILRTDLCNRPHLRALENRYESWGFNSR